MPEDLIIAKLIYGSQQDIEDAIAVFLNLKDKINLAYLKRRAVEETVLDLLEKLFQHSNL